MAMTTISRREWLKVAAGFGIAVAAVAHGQLLRGADNQAGEIGHWSCPLLRSLSSKKAGAAAWRWDPQQRLGTTASLAAMLAAASGALGAAALALHEWKPAR